MAAPALYQADGNAAVALRTRLAALESEFAVAYGRWAELEARR